MGAGASIILLAGGEEAIVDRDDAERVMAHKWRLRLKRGSARAVIGDIGSRTRGRQTVFLHRFILRPPAGALVDHRDGNVLNNRRANLRICRTSQNRANSVLRSDSKTGFKGVRYQRARNRWRASVNSAAGRRYGAQRRSPEEAARDYDRMARAIHREFACVNFPRDGERGAL